MDELIAFKRYFEAASAAPSPTWRTVYLLGLMCAAAVNHRSLVAFVDNTGYGHDWPDPRPPDAPGPMPRKTH